MTSEGDTSDYASSSSSFFTSTLDMPTPTRMSPNNSCPTSPTLSLRIPSVKIRNLIKLDPDVQVVSQESVHLLTKATELFIASLAQESYEVTLKSSKKIISRSDVDTVLEQSDPCAFLLNGDLLQQFDFKDLL
ncbi:POLE4 [Lepeophtheirus salmonis]|uniref:POLE4 n=1 Tax=Lepeophtheirus salmonis TaxID=72036 RepID=A0A7R8CTX6_LEPSM|nr:DNA polymerase epsilon subunit 4-like [Lepeophtheirus salmonis]CAB4063826.1 POLE4 [Lepeophtheirus salmonis]CAF2930236.1 POLE4 [Lepeophtheirus salmonis]